MLYIYHCDKRHAKCEQCKLVNDKWLIARTYSGNIKPGSKLIIKFIQMI